MDLKEALNTLLLEWGKYDEKECGKVQGTRFNCGKPTLHWESASTPRAADDPDRVPATQIPRSINEEWFYNQEVQRQENGKGYVQGAMVVLWDTLSAEDKEQWIKEMNMSTEPWVLFRSKTGKANASAPTTADAAVTTANICLLYTSPSPRDGLLSRMPSSA